MTRTQLDVDGLVAGWTFEPSPLTRELKRMRRRRRIPGVWFAPAHAVLKPVTDRTRWVLYFMYLPHGRLTATHLFTLERLRTLDDTSLCVVLASPGPDQVPNQVDRLSDALIWKHVDGYDFSAYALGLHEIAQRSPGSDVFVMNDSVFGPFEDLAGVFERAAWDLTGFTGSSKWENHVQSYAFVLRQVTPQRMSGLRSVLPRGFSYSHPFDVVLLQELQLARVAASSMSVGARWFSADSAHVKDPTLLRPLELLAAGHPFLKRSLLTKHAGFQARDEVLSALHDRGHPDPGLYAS